MKKNTYRTDHSYYSYCSPLPPAPPGRTRKRPAAPHQDAPPTRRPRRHVRGDRPRSARRTVMVDAGTQTERPHRGPDEPQEAPDEEPDAAATPDAAIPPIETGDGQGNAYTRLGCIHIKSSLFI